MLIYLIIAAIFWFNPLISNVDILPDVIGYILVIKAFSKASYVYDYAEDVCTSAKKMCIVTGVKVFTIFFVSSLDPSMSLLMSFSFGVIELIFGIPFFSNLFYAFSKMVSDEDGGVYNSSLGSVKYFTVASFIARLVLAFLPDLSALSLDYSMGNTDYSYMRFKPLFIVFSVFISLIVCIVWLVVYLRYLKRVIKKEAVLKINADFDSQLNNKKAIFVAKDSIKATIVIAVASLFIFDIKFGYTNVDYFQDFVFTAVAALAFLYLFIKGVYKLDKMSIALVGALLIHIGADAFEIYANKAYFEKYNYASMLKISKAEDMYLTVCISGICSAVALVLATTVILLIMRVNARKNISNNAHLFSQSDIDYFLSEFDRRTKKNIAIAITVAVLSGVVYSLLVIFRPFAEWMILVDVIFELIYIISFISSTLYIHDEVYKRILTYA